MVRDELWEKAEESVEPKRSFNFRTCASFGARSFGIAMAIVCLCTFPIAQRRKKSFCRCFALI